MLNSASSHPYLRAFKKFPALRQQAQERLSKRPEHAGRPVIPEVVDDRPNRPAGPAMAPTTDATVVRRARNERGQFVSDNPHTPNNEAWVDASNP
jgi:hypothetical protein